MKNEGRQDSLSSAPQGADYFSVFELPRLLSLDTKELERVFYRKSRAVHPDRYARGTEAEQQWSLEQTSMLNDAYRALKDPIARTEYLLKLEGVAQAENANGKPERVGAPPDLLSEVFELNMQIDELRMNTQAGEDDPQIRAELEQSQQRFERMLAAIDAEIEAGWTIADAVLEQGDSASAERRRSLEVLAKLLDRRRFVRNLVRDVGAALATAA